MPSPSSLGLSVPCQLLAAEVNGVRRNSESRSLSRSLAWHRAGGCVVGRRCRELQPRKCRAERGGGGRRRTHDGEPGLVSGGRRARGGSGDEARRPRGPCKEGVVVVVGATQGGAPWLAAPPPPPLPVPLGRHFPGAPTTHSVGVTFFWLPRLLSRLPADVLVHVIPLSSPPHLFSPPTSQSHSNRYVSGGWLEGWS